MATKAVQVIQALSAGTSADTSTLVLDGVGKAYELLRSRDISALYTTAQPL